jgi:hypothetical protein
VVGVQAQGFLGVQGGEFVVVGKGEEEGGVGGVGQVAVRLGYGLVEF